MTPLLWGEINAILMQYWITLTHAPQHIDCGAVNYINTTIVVPLHLINRLLSTKVLFDIPSFSTTDTRLYWWEAITFTAAFRQTDWVWTEAIFVWIKAIAAARHWLHFRQDGGASRLFDVRVMKCATSPASAVGVSRYGQWWLLFAYH